MIMPGVTYWQAITMHSSGGGGHFYSVSRVQIAMHGSQATFGQSEIRLVIMAEKRGGYATI